MAGGYSPVIEIPLHDPRGGANSIDAALFEPEGAGPFPAVIVLSGCGGTGDDVEIVKRLNASYLPMGVATLVIDSFTTRQVRDACTNPNTVSPHRRAEDTYEALAWLSARPEIDAKHVFIQGYSHGASAAIDAISEKTANQYSRKFAGVVAFYPYCMPGTRFSVPTIILSGEMDDWTPASRCLPLAGQPNVEVTVYPGAWHAFATPGLDQVTLGHRAAYQEAAATDGQRRAAALISAALKK